MKKSYFTAAKIAAPRSRVWEVLLGAQTYPKWVAVFGPFMRFSGSWELGSEVQFSDEDGEGLIVRVLSHVPGAIVKFEYVAGLTKGDREEFSGADVEWLGASEEWGVFDLVGGGTLFYAELQYPQSQIAHFAEQWPKAIEAIKQLSEAK